MAFIKKRGKAAYVLVIGLLIIILTGAVIGGLYYLYQMKITELKKEKDEKIQELQFELYSLAREALIPKKEIKNGTILTPELFEKVNIKLGIEPELLLDETDMGKINTVTIPAGTPALKSMAAESIPEKDVREMELNMFLIQTNQKQGDYVDVRITYPNGESYIVLSKKQLKGLNLRENIVWLWLDETEIHNISSAIVDAYMYQGTKLHILTYILPELQEASIPFYAANNDVLDLMKKDPNILEKASDFLAREARALIESHLSMMAAEDLNEVDAGVNEEINKNKKIIETEAHSSGTAFNSNTAEENDEISSFQ